MTGGPISKQALNDGLVAHICASLQISPESEQEMDGVQQIADAALDYFTSSVKGAPAGSGQALLWAIFSGLWEGCYQQEAIDAFFGSVNIDAARMLEAWKALPAEDQKGPFSVVLVPGNLQEADIVKVVQSLYLHKGEKA